MKTWRLALESQGGLYRIDDVSYRSVPVLPHISLYIELQREPFNAFGPTSGVAMPNYNGPATGPDIVELGWKDTVKMYPGTVTTVIMRFDLPANPPGIKPMPNSLNTNLGTSGKEYVWHCHILEHEEHNMMRPLVSPGRVCCSRARLDHKHRNSMAS